MTAFYAHSVDGKSHEEWELLEEHLSRVADGDDMFPGAAGFAGIFGAETCGRVLGLWHDLGKYCSEFQRYLKLVGGGDAHLETVSRVDHSTAGARHAFAQATAAGRQGVGRLLAHCVAGHHGGLPDSIDESGGVSGLNSRLEKDVPSVDAAPATILEEPCPQFPRLNFRDHPDDRSFQAAMFTRMLFSCLVDADYLATEGFLRPDQARQRRRRFPTVRELLNSLDVYLGQLSSSASKSTVNEVRSEILQNCRRAGQLEKGFFSLTVPTGGGKTLSSLAFALTHALHHGLRRVIYAIPFTSIIEQNTDVFRRALSALGTDVVLEHHSNIEPEGEARWARLATENWEAPVVVTTNVQLFESLFAAKPSRCRKLHRIARSVVVLDEVQTLPVDLLQPSLAALAELCRNYDATVVLCSATQPAVARRPDFAIGLENVREIVEQPLRVYADLKRTEIQMAGRLSDNELAGRLSAEPQVLCVVNTRPHAAALYRRMMEAATDGCLHLSAQMCPRHRTAVLRLIRRRLQRNQPCRVVSTQLVEAGVDLDFPVVYRAMAGLDSIAQAAGRCNREGKLTCGRVVVFETDAPPPHFVKQAAQDTREVLVDHSDPLDLDAIEEYFRLHYWKREDQWDKHRVMECFAKGGLHLQFREAAERYRLIRDEQKPVIVPYGRAGKRLMDEIRCLPEPPGRDYDRRLQRHVVGVPKRTYETLLHDRTAVMYHERFCLLENEEAYDRFLGLRLDVTGPNPASLIV